MSGSPSCVGTSIPLATAPACRVMVQPGTVLRIPGQRLLSLLSFSLCSHFLSIFPRAGLRQTSPDNGFCQGLPDSLSPSPSWLPGPWEKLWTEPPRESLPDSQNQGTRPPRPHLLCLLNPSSDLGTYPAPWFIWVTGRSSTGGGGLRGVESLAPPSQPGALFWPLWKC